MSISRREINELCTEHDRLMREMEASGHWVPPPKRPPPREKAAPVALEYRTYENSASTAPAPVVSTDPALVEAIGRALARERKLAREARAKEIAPLQTEIAELRGQVKCLLALLRKDDEGKVVPKLAWERDSA